MTTANPVGSLLLRPIGERIARVLSRTPATPNFVTSVTLMAGLAAGGALAAGWHVAGGAAIVATSVLDAVDSALARLKGMTSRFGAVFDAVADRYADFAILGGMTVYATRFEDWPQPEAVGMAALAAALTVSYAGARTAASLGDQSATGDTWLGGRDTWLVVAAAGAIAGQGYWSLAAVATMNALAATWRLLYMRLRRVGLGP